MVSLIAGSVDKHVLGHNVALNAVIPFNSVLYLNTYLILLQYIF